MKKFIAFAILVAQAFFAFSQNLLSLNYENEKFDGYFEGYDFSHSSLFGKGNYVNGEKDGKWSYYTEGGKLLVETETYKNGKLHGSSITYYYEDKDEEYDLDKWKPCYRYTNYENGKIQGIQEERDCKDGMLFSKCEFENGVENGRFMQWYGEFFYIKGIFREGQKVGEWKLVKTYEEDFEDEQEEVVWLWNYTYDGQLSRVTMLDFEWFEFSNYQHSESCTRKFYSQLSPDTLLVVENVLTDCLGKNADV